MMRCEEPPQSAPPVLLSCKAEHLGKASHRSKPIRWFEDQPYERHMQP